MSLCINCGCSNPCACQSSEQLPYFTDVCLQSSQQHCDQTYICHYNPIIRVSQEWAVPEGSQLITLNISALVGILIGAVLWNPTYGSYLIVSYDQEGQSIKVQKSDNNSVEPGTVIPSCTKFLLINDQSLLISDLAYAISWDGVTDAAPSKNAVYDKIQSVINKRHIGVKVWNPPSVADGAVTSTTLTVLGAFLGDTVNVGFTIAVPAGALLVGAVTAVDTVTVTLFNKTGAPLDLVSGTLRADCWSF